jgi:hypothetical protein
MVGIAGEDDLDAPPDVTNDRPAQSTVEAGLASNPSAAPAPSASPFGNGNSPPVNKKLNAEESTAIRARLIQEIETLPQDDLQARAIAILKAKNRLSADDAKLVEETFAAKMALQGVSSEATATEEPASAPIAPSPPQPPLAMDAVKRPRGRPRKVKAPIDLTQAPPILRHQPSPTIPRRLRRIFTPMRLPPESKKASLRSASRAGIAIKPTSNSWHHSRVLSVGEAPLTPTTCVSPSSAQWDAR